METDETESTKQERNFKGWVFTERGTGQIFIVVVKDREANILLTII